MVRQSAYAHANSVELRWHDFCAGGCRVTAAIVLARPSTGRTRASPERTLQTHSSLG